MGEHPIENLMGTAMNSIKDMIDVNTIIGDPIQASNNIVIIPISKVSFGFVAGGSEFKGETIDEYNKRDKDEQIQYRLPFGGGSGAGVSVNPIAFLVVQSNVVKLLPVDHDNTFDKILDYVPDLMEKLNCMVDKCLQNKKDLGEKIIFNMTKKDEKQNEKQNEKQKEKQNEQKNDEKVVKKTEINYEEIEQE